MEGANILAKSCKCRNESISKSQWKRQGINPDTTDLTFTNFKVWNKESKRGKEIATSFYSIITKESNGEMKSKSNSIIFCGQVGCGKTHLSIALALNLIKMGKEVVYMPYRDVITKIKQNILDREFYLRLVDKYKNSSILVIDDLYKGKVTDSDINIMFEIINYRYLNRKTIIVSSEYTIGEIINIDEGVGSRIYEMCKNFTVEFEKSRENNYRLRSE